MPSSLLETGWHCFYVLLFVFLRLNTAPHVLGDLALEKLCAVPKCIPNEIVEFVDE